MTGFPEQGIYGQLARIGKALSNPIRLRLLDLLDTGELTVEEVAELAGLPVKNTSAQLQVLRAAQLVTARREGTRVHYRVAGDRTSAFLGAYHELARDSLADLRAEIERELGPDEELRPVTADELRRLQRAGSVVVVDVRGAADFERDHVPGAISVPEAELGDRIGDRLADLPTGTEVVAYCQGPYCVSSPRAARLMQEHGVAARYLAGGWTGWTRSTAAAKRSSVSPHPRA